MDIYDIIYICVIKWLKSEQADKQICSILDN